MRRAPHAAVVTCVQRGQVGVDEVGGSESAEADSRRAEEGATAAGQAGGGWARAVQGPRDSDAQEELRDEICRFQRPCRQLAGSLPPPGQSSSRATVLSRSAPCSCRCHACEQAIRYLHAMCVCMREEYVNCTLRSAESAG